MWTRVALSGVWLNAAEVRLDGLSSANLTACFASQSSALRDQAARHPHSLFITLGVQGNTGSMSVLRTQPGRCA